MAATPSDIAAPRERDAELLAALAVDRTRALGVLYDRHAGLVYGLAMKILGNQAEAEDLTQEIFLSLCGKCDYDPARGTLTAFLVTLTRSRAIDRIRSRGRKARLIDTLGEEPITDEPPPSPLEQLSLAESSERVRTALAALPEAQRRVLELSYYRGLSQTEIAAELDTPLGTVKSWARRGLFTLRESLAPLAG
ncbi:MAG TPA: sigma-70 family RNA polymerase sigma factor [Candidatus Binatia bacterium]|jgi:RNA polymerase sigma-70 factor (ECF subfamily)